MLIEHFSHELEPPYDGDGKRTFFLVPTRPLVKQQAAEIVAKSRFGKDDVGEYTGDMNVDFWSKDIWLEHFRHKKVLVMTRQIFLNNLNSGALPLKKVNREKEFSQSSKKFFFTEFLGELVDIR